MLKLMSFLMVAIFATVVVADAEVPLPGPGAPPTTPPPPQPTPPQTPAPTPPPSEPYPTPYPTPTPYPGQPGNPNDQTYTLGQGQVGRFKERSFVFTPPANLRNIRALRVTCTNEKVKLTGVFVKFTNGQTLRQPVLEGLYRTGDVKIDYMTSAPVASVSITATTSSVFRTNGVFRVDAAASPLSKADDGDQPQQSFEMLDGNNEAF